MARRELKVLQEVHEELLTSLTGEEQHARAQALVRTLLDVEEMQESLAHYVKEQKEGIRDKKASVTRLRDILKTGAEARIQLCRWLADPSSGEALLVRADDSKRVLRRVLTEEERQECLPLGDTVAQRFAAIEVD